MTNVRQTLNKRVTLWASLLVILSPVIINAGGAGTSGGLSLVEVMSARASALDEAFTAVSDDISAFGYNPASLKTLKTGQASFLYQQGLAEDSFGQFVLGTPTSRGSLGLSVGYYNGGTIELYDGSTTRSVNAQTDLTVGVGYSNNVGPISFGLTGKYLSSQLIEQEKAVAYAADFGLSAPVSSRVRVGAAVQNIGTELKFVDEGDPLPRVARAGMAINLMAHRSVTLLLDSAYFMNEAELRPSAGLEMNFGLLAMRAGYKKSSGADEFSVGTGIGLGRSSVDYSFGMIQGLDSRHRISLSMRFGGEGVPTSFSKAIQSTPRVVEKEESENNGEPETKAAEVVAPRRTLAEVTTPVTASRAAARRIYTVRPGDSLAKISRKFFGGTHQAKTIYSANKHLIADPAVLEPGQKIIIPQ